MDPLRDGLGSWDDSASSLLWLLCPLSLFQPKSQNWLIFKSGIDLIWWLRAPYFSGFITILNYIVMHEHGGKNSDCSEGVK